RLSVTLFPYTRSSDLGDDRLELEAELFLEPGNELLDLFVAERECTGDLRQRGALEFVLEKFELFADLGQHQNAVVVDQQLDEIRSEEHTSELQSRENL